MRTAPIRSPLDGSPTPPPARPTDAVPAQRFADALRQQSVRAAIGSTLRGEGRGDGVGLGADRAPIVAAPPPPPSPVYDAAPAPSSSPPAQRSAEATRTTTPPARHEGRHDDAAPGRSDAVASDAAAAPPAAGSADAITPPGAPPAAEPGAMPAGIIPPAGASGAQDAGHPASTAGSAGVAARAAPAVVDAELTADATEPAAGVTPGHAKRPAADAAANDAAVNPWLAALAMPPMPSAPVEAAAVAPAVAAVAATATATATAPAVAVAAVAATATATATPTPTATAAVAATAAVDVAVPVDGAVATPAAGVEADRRSSAMPGTSRTLRAGFGKDAERSGRAERLDRTADDRVVALPAGGALPDFHPIAARDTGIAAAAVHPADLAAAAATPPAGVPPLSPLPAGLAGAAPTEASAAHLAGGLDAASSMAVLNALRPPVVAGGAENRPAPPVATLPVPFGAPQFADALGAQVSLYAAGGVQQAELRLNPAETGPIHIQIALDGTQARVDFHAASAATRQAIEAGLPALAVALRDQGLTLAGGGVFDQSSRRGAEAGGEGRRDGTAEGGRRGDRAAPAAPAIGAAAGAGAAGTQRALRGSAGRLDVYA